MRLDSHHAIDCYDCVVRNTSLKIFWSCALPIETFIILKMLFEKYGVKGHCSTLEFLGYRVKWSGLDPENAEIMA